MIRVSVTDLKSHLSKYLRLVKQGELIEVLERSVPIARIEAIREGGVGESDRERLVRDGVLSPARVRASAEILETAPVPCSADAVRILIEERGNR